MSKIIEFKEISKDFKISVKKNNKKKSITKFQNLMDVMFQLKKLQN